MAKASAMMLRPCPFCDKEIPMKMTVCPYCHLDETGQPVQMDSTITTTPGPDKFFENDLKELASDDPFVRDQATVRMAQKGFGVVHALIGVLSDHAKPGLAGVAKVLGRVGDRRAILVLAEAAKMGDEELRTAAVWALTQFHEPEILPILISEAERPHPTIQAYLAHIFGTSQDASVIPVLAKLARHTNREVAFQAAYALGETGDRQAIGPLRKAARRQDPIVRAAVMVSLRRLGASPLRIRIAWISLGATAAACAAVCFWWVHR